MLVQPVQKHKFSTIIAKKQHNSIKNELSEKPILTCMPATPVSRERMGNILYIVLIAGFGCRKTGRIRLDFRT
jgi:hypothetical protein